MVFFFQAVTRITERDGVSSEDALRRLQSQWSNAKQVERANVVLSTLWEPEVTRKQVTHRAIIAEHMKIIFAMLILPFPI